MTMHTEKDKLANFILQHRAEFDDEYPSLQVWAGIERQLPPPPAQRRRLVFRYLSMAAAVAALVAIGIVVGLQLGITSNDPNLASSVDFQEMQRYYSEQIDRNYARLTKLGPDPQLDADLAQIDAAMTELYAEIEAAPPGQEKELIEKLIHNYRLKAQLLEYVLERLSQQNEQPQPINNHATEL